MSDALALVDAINASSYPVLSAYMRTKVRLHMVASRTWLVMHQLEVAPCDLCVPTRRLATHNLISFSYRIGNRTEYRVCHKCTAKLLLRRETEQRYAELRVYAPIRAQRTRHGVDTT